MSSNQASKISKGEILRVSLEALAYLLVSGPLVYFYLSYGDFGFNPVYVWLGAISTAAICCITMVASKFVRCCVKVTLVYCLSGVGLLAAFLIVSWVFVAQDLVAASKTCDPSETGGTLSATWGKAFLRNIGNCHKVIPVPALLCFLYSLYFVYSTKNEKPLPTASEPTGAATSVKDSDESKNTPSGCLVDRKLATYAYGFILGLIFGSSLTLYFGSIMTFHTCVSLRKIELIPIPFISWGFLMYLIVSTVVVFLTTCTSKGKKYRINIVKNSYKLSHMMDEEGRMEQTPIEEHEMKELGSGVGSSRAPSVHLGRADIRLAKMSNAVKNTKAAPTRADGSSPTFDVFRP